MSERPPILPDPLASAGRVAIEIVDLEPDMRPEALENAERGLYETARREGRTEGEAKFFAHEMRRLITEAVQRIERRGAAERAAERARP